MTVTRPTRLLLTLFGALAISNACQSMADTLQMPEQQETQTAAGSEPWNVPIPQHGMTKAQVESQFGSPQAKDGPRGTPPIYFWEYPEFTVYFESDYVIHTVRKYRK